MASVDEVPPAPRYSPRRHAATGATSGMAIACRAATSGELERYRIWGRRCSKMDWALNGLFRGRAQACRRAATVHLRLRTRKSLPLSTPPAQGSTRRRPTSSSPSRACTMPHGRPPVQHTAWAYCHVPHGSTVDMTEAPGGPNRTVLRQASGTACSLAALLLSCNPRAV